MKDKFSMKFQYLSILSISVLGLGIPFTSLLEAKELEGEALTPQYYLPCLHAEETHRELGLSEEQVAKLETIFRKYDGPWWQARNMKEEQRREVVAKVEKATREEANRVLDSKQRDRLEQIVRQAQSLRALLREDAGATLELTKDQKSELLKLAKKTIEAGQSKSKSKEDLQQIQLQEAEAIKKLLNPSQHEKMFKLYGDRIDTASMARIYPLAPELIVDGNWLQPKAREITSLADLQGKVVAVHFYAFQCSNCRANLPIYNQWHKELASKGIQLIGIQTPETPDERKLDRVSSAATSPSTTCSASVSAPPWSASPRNCRVACSSASASRARLRCRPSCSCSTNPSACSTA